MRRGGRTPHIRVISPIRRRTGRRVVAELTRFHYYSYHFSLRYADITIFIIVAVRHLGLTSYYYTVSADKRGPL